MNDTLKKLCIVLGLCVALGFLSFVFFKQKTVAPTVSETASSSSSTSTNQASSSQQTLTITTANAQKQVYIEHVDTPAARTQGLSGRKSLAADHGMLFVFEKPGIYPFWMPDMYISLDMIWINTEKRIVHIEKNVGPESYPKTFKSTVPAQYVLEVPAGFSEQNSVEVGNTIAF